MAESQVPPTKAKRARPEELLSNSRNRLVKHLLAYVTPVFDSTIEALFELAEKGATPDIQNRLFEAQRILRNKKTSFTESFSDLLRTQFDDFTRGQPAAHEDEKSEQSALDSDGMELVEEQDLEESLAISDMVSKAEVKFTQEIYALNQRLAVLTGGKPVKSDVNPCGPTQIGGALRQASECLTLDTAVKVRLFHRFDRALQKNIDVCYKDINGYLAEAGILPNIKFSTPKRANRPAAPPAAAPGQDEGEPEQHPGQASPIMAPPTATAAPTRATATHAASPADVAHPGQNDFFGRTLQASTPPTGTEQRPSASVLRNLLRKTLGGQRAASQSAAQNYVVAPQQQVQSALTTLQHRMQQVDETAVGRISPDEVKEALQASLGTDPDSGRPVGLAEQHVQTIDILGMMYDHIDSEEILQQPVKNMLHKLQVPMIRVALQEDEFFDDQDHPARQFFNSVADAGELWLEDNPEDSGTLKKMQTAIDKVLEEYQGDNEVFKALLGDLNKHIKVLSRKATLAEKRHVEAARGQEKLEQARERAHSLVKRLIEKYHPPKFVESVLSQPWSDFLALTVLRHGEDSEQWKKALTVAKTLIFSVRDDLDPKVKDNLRKRVPWLRKELSNGLSHVGYFEQDVEALLANLDACHRWSLAPEKPAVVPDKPEAQTQESASEKAQLPEPEAPAPVPAPAPTEKPKELNQPLPESEVRPVAPTAKIAPRPEKPKLDSNEKAMLAKIRLMPFGSWFELRGDPSAEWTKRKLSWYSPLTGRCLFVNNRGAIADEMTLYDLAKDMAAGNARVFSPNSKPLLDRALDAIFGRLRKLKGSDRSDAKGEPAN